MLTTNQKGAIAEISIARAAIDLGIDVYRPVVEGGRYDLIFGLGTSLLRIQCKWATASGGGLLVRCYSARRAASGIVRRPYTADEIDAICAYAPDLDRCYFLPFSWIGGRRQVVLRTEPTRNNQAEGIHWASEFELKSLHWLQHFAGP